MKRKGFTLIELLVVVAIIALLISILLPSLARARELSKRAVCAANVRGIGQSCKVYSNDFNESWPIAPSYKGAAFTGLGRIGSPNHRNGPLGNPAGYGGLAIANPTIGQSFWILVKGGSTTNKQFLCPSSSDSADNTANPMTYYDFGAGSNLSYGYQNPYVGSAIPNEGLDPGMPMIADKGRVNVTLATVATNLTVKDLNQWTPDSWKQANSTHHSDGEGQNVLYGDGHAEFMKKSIAGLPRDPNVVDPNGPTVAPYNLASTPRAYQDPIFENWSRLNSSGPAWSSSVGSPSTALGGEPRDANDASIAHEDPTNSPL
jgi:prepilin-type N-terminal cleavage/methylation domain-containing protein/prepilin-type processing-associated H-X9-DG protein